MGVLDRVVGVHVVVYVLDPIHQVLGLPDGPGPVVEPGAVTHRDGTLLTGQGGETPPGDWTHTHTQTHTYGVVDYE